MDGHFLLQGIFPTQELNPGLLHCRQILCRLSYEGNPYSGLENSMDCIVHGVEKSRARLSDFHFHFTFILPPKFFSLLSHPPAAISSCWTSSVRLSYLSPISSCYLCTPTPILLLLIVPKISSPQNLAPSWTPSPEASLSPGSSSSAPPASVGISQMIISSLSPPSIPFPCDLIYLHRFTHPWVQTSL